jgi:hypothetical protein
MAIFTNDRKMRRLHEQLQGSLIFELPEASTPTRTDVYNLEVTGLALTKDPKYVMPSSLLNEILMPGRKLTTSTRLCVDSWHCTGR